MGVSSAKIGKDVTTTTTNISSNNDAMLMQTIQRHPDVALHAHVELANTEDSKPRISEVYLVLQGEGTCHEVHALNTEARNAMMRNNPTLLRNTIASGLRGLADRQGTYREQGCVVSWKPSFVPFHQEYTIKRSSRRCQHLASIRNQMARDPVS